MSVFSKYFLRFRRVVAVVALSLALVPVVAQDFIPMEVSCQVEKIVGGNPQFTSVEYHVFKSVNAALKAKAELKRAISEDGAGVPYPNTVEVKAKYSGWKRSRADGSFKVKGAARMAVLVYADDSQVEVFEIEEGKTDYYLKINMKTTIKEVFVDGEMKLGDVIIAKPVVEDATFSYFPIKFMLQPGRTRTDSRLLLQPVVVDCQTSDTVGVISPMVYEGASYHERQILRKGFDYFGHDPVAPAYKSRVLPHNAAFEVDTTIVFRKPVKNRTYKSVYRFVLEDFHHKYYEGGDQAGSCYPLRPFKMLDYTEATAEMPLTDEFYEAAESHYEVVPRMLRLKFVQGEDVLTDDSLNNVELQTLVRELRSYGNKLIHVKVVGAASPEGSAGLNRTLAGKRARKALSILRGELSGIDFQYTTDLKVYSWADVLEQVEKVADSTVVRYVRNVIASNDERHVYGVLKNMPFYESVIVPVLNSQRIMQCEYVYEIDHAMTPEEVVAAYNTHKEQYRAGERPLSEGDFYNLFANIKDSAELDVLTEMAYSRMIKRPGYENLKLSPYVANRMALLSLRRGLPDLGILAPFVDLKVLSLPQGVDYAKRDRDGNVLMVLNRKEILANQAVAYFQQLHTDTAYTIINRLPRDERTDRFRKCINFTNLYMKYLMEPEGLTAEERRDCLDGYRYVMADSVNRVIFTVEMNSGTVDPRQHKSREELIEMISTISDDDARKWYLMGIVWADKDVAGKETAIPIAELEEPVPYFLAYFQRSFDMDPKFLKFYATEGNVGEKVRELYDYDPAKAGLYRKMFDILYKAYHTDRDGNSAEALPEGEAAAEGEAMPQTNM